MYARQVALENIDAHNGDLRNCSIAVLGWVGNTHDLSILNNVLLNDKRRTIKRSRRHCYAPSLV
jgi:hypothetical protein